MSAIRVVVAEDDVLLRSGVVALLRTVDGIEVAGEAGSLPELLEMVRQCEPDVVVTDVRMPPNQSDEGIEAARQIRASAPNTGVVVLSQHAEPEYVLSVFEAGNDRLGYLLGRPDCVAHAPDPGEAPHHQHHQRDRSRHAYRVSCQP